MKSSTPEELEFCIACGDFAVLDASSGWCVNCTLDSTPPGVCIKCGREFALDIHTRRVCSTCRKHAWFDRNGDRLDILIAQGLTLKAAVKYVAKTNRPICYCCGNSMSNASRGHAIFCTRTKECRRAARSYRYYKETKGLNAEQALLKVKESLVINEYLS